MTPDGFRAFVEAKNPVLSLSLGGTEKNKVKGMISREGAKKTNAISKGILGAFAPLREIRLMTSPWAP
jgi:hypothetical protein